MVWKGKWWNHFQVAALVDWVCEGGFSWNEKTKTTLLAQAALIKYQHSLQQQILISHDSGGKAALDRGVYRCSSWWVPFSWFEGAASLMCPSSHGRESESSGLPSSL